MSEVLNVSVVVPVYRAENCLKELCRRLVKVVEVYGSYEIIFVEDCGGDNSWEVIEAVSKENFHVRGIKLSRNFGQQAATICGMANSRGHIVITIDDDLEQQPEDIAALVEKFNEGYQLVYGTFPQRTHAFWRNLTSDCVRRLFKFAIPELHYSYSSFRAIDGKIARSLKQFESPFPFIDGYLSWVVSRYATVETRHSSRISGKSNYSIRKLISLAINCFVTFSDLPLKAASFVGFFSFFTGMLWAFWIVLSKLLGEVQVSGFSSIMAGITVFGGLQLLILGILGEYLSRVNFKTSKKPLYVVSETVEDMGGEK